MPPRQRRSSRPAISTSMFWPFRGRRAFATPAARRRRATNARPAPAEGFVVHGLWPENADRPYPADCGEGGYIPGAALRQTHGLYPDEGLARYEFRKHGTCTGLSPENYFAAVKFARDEVAIPPMLQAPHEALSTLAERDRERVHRRQSQAHLRKFRADLFAWRADRSAHLHRQGARRFRRLSEGRRPHLSCAHHLRRAVALSAPARRLAPNR